MSESAPDRLDSWKDIALYLRRDVSTVQRWEKREGMPVHRHQHDKAGSVYAYASELDAWLQSRQGALDARSGTQAVPGAAGPDVVLPPAEELDSRPMAPPDAATPPAVTTSTPEPGAPAWRRLLRNLNRFGDRPGTASSARRATIGILAAFGVLVGLGATFAVWNGGSLSGVRHQIRSLVILPLENLSGDPDQDFFADGLTEELTSALARIPSLRVVSRTSAMTFKGHDRPLPAIAQVLAVDGVIEGSVRRVGDRVRINVQLVHGPSDTHLWTQEFDTPLTDVLDLQTQVAREVASQIRVQMASSSGSPRAVDPAAYEAYLRGRFHLWKFNEPDWVKAVEYFERSIAIDPGYAPAYAGLANTWWARAVTGSLPMAEGAGPARAAATKALALDENLAEAHAHLAYVQGIFDWDWAAAERSVRRAVELGPSSVDALYVYAVLLMAMGRQTEGIEWIERAVRMDPLASAMHSMAGRIRYRARRYDEAIAPLKRAIELEPGNPFSYGRLIDVYLAQGRYPEALELHGKMPYLPGGRGRSQVLVQIYAAMGRTDEARTLAQSTGTPMPLDALVALGEHDAAFEQLFKALDERRQWNPFIKDDPAFDPLHADPRWPQLLARMNLR